MPSVKDKLLSLKTHPRYHGNGFAQWYLSERVRLHLWDLRLKGEMDAKFGIPPHHNSTVHDHTWDMHSTILMGTLNHKIYGIVDDDPEPLLASYDADYWEIDKGADGSSFKKGAQHRVQVIHAFNMNEGSSYFQQRRTFHESSPLGSVVVTLMRKSNDLPSGARPRLLVKEGEKPFDAFPKIDQSICTPLLLDAFRQIPEEVFDRAVARINLP